MQPRPSELRFDLDAALDAVVMLRSEVPEDAFTAQILGTERAGSGVVIGDGLVLTIGYLITEASTIWLTTNAGQVIGAHALGYDQPSGLGLVQALGRLDAPALARGTAATCGVGDGVIVAGHGGRAHALEARVFARREFAGYWEYVLDDALFTTPAHPLWGGAAVIGADGRLLGVGSLFVEEMVGERKVEGNMVGADRPAGADPGRPAAHGPRQAPAAALARAVRHRARAAAGGRRAGAGRAGRARRAAGRRHGGGSRGRAGRGAGGPVPQGLAPGRSRGRGPAHAWPATASGSRSGSPRSTARDLLKKPQLH